MSLSTVEIESRGARQPSGPLTIKDFKGKAEPDWCPGCGDFGVLSALKMALAELGVRPHEAMVISGIGCSSNLPGYINTYGMHTLHGRALSVATGAQMANHELKIIVTGGDGDGYGIGGKLFQIRRLENGDWQATLVYETSRLKAKFTNVVVYQEYIYGLDDGIMVCLDPASGERKWKGGRYGNGQLVLLPEQNLLLVLSEQGELVLVSATPGEFKEIAKFPAINGKTWNHPALVGDVVLVRNDREMAAFRLAPAGG